MSAAAAPASVEDRLALYAHATRAAMTEALAAGQPAAYLYDLVREYPARAGKGLRPALLLAACQAHGGLLDDGLPAAVALEMLHNAFLIHDDVEDASPTRRGAATLHEAHGVPLAVNAGDALAALALEPLLAGGGRLGSRLAGQVAAELLTMVRLTTEGQALELGWRRGGVVDLGVEDYLALAVRKTCWYTTVAPLRLGAIVGSHGTAPLQELSRFGVFLGIAFQIRDDLLSLESGGGDGDGADGAGDGKEPLGDLREGKRTLMLIHLLAAADGEDFAWLVRWLGRPDGARDAAGAARVLALLHAHGSLGFAREVADGMAAAACASFDAAFAAAAATGPPGPRRFLRELIPYVLDRRA